MSQQVLKTHGVPIGTASTDRPAATDVKKAAGAEAELELRNVRKEFHSRSGSVVALEDVSLTIGRREFVALVGRSGFGKTTLLRILAGLAQPSSGDVRAGGGR